MVVVAWSKERGGPSLGDGEKKSVMYIGAKRLSDLVVWMAFKASTALTTMKMRFDALRDEAKGEFRVRILSFSSAAWLACFETGTHTQSHRP